MFSREFHKVFKTTYFCRASPVTASGRSPSHFQKDCAALEAYLGYYQTIFFAKIVDGSTIDVLNMPLMQQESTSNICLDTILPRYSSIASK